MESELDAESCSLSPPRHSALRKSHLRDVERENKDIYSLGSSRQRSLPMLQLCIRRGAQASRPIPPPGSSIRLLLNSPITASPTGLRRFAVSSHCKAPHNEVVPLRKQLKDQAKASREAHPHGSHGANRVRHVQADGGLADWELTVGIEIHAQLNTANKLFSSAST